MSGLKAYKPKKESSELDEIRALIKKDKDNRCSICSTKFFKDVEKIVNVKVQS